MAFFSRAGSLLRQAVSKHTNINHEMSVTSPSLFQMVRCMSTGGSSKVFVGGLAWATDDNSLREAFCAYGEVYEARVIVDRETGRSRGFGFVTFADTEAASAAIQAMDQRELHGRMVRVNYANERTQGSGGFRGGYGGGGYGGGGYGGGGYGGSGGGGYGSGGYGGNDGGNNYRSGGYGGESQNFGGGDSFGNDNADSGNTFGDADTQVNGSYRDNDDTDDFAKRA
ncbi:glycine-rich RNA-binding protein 4, mitochondrial-like [Bidens hawaiensis]|uniref:glycine-rich RNA-binding protein 4, mitochondrial-like n=1 Tax=Bidens hawaiensis TaxID=980011 RepID=UPI00404B3D19